ncbi:DUF3021 domain-containing protein [Solibacillus sp. A46]|uniref:DUF3021 domain-containing protein n=1 Tax=Solibacillus faecavium TaxID=2762221 RepID=A0ABR8XWS2_9BACL|nr:DUF3021 domain-containing protein [Solibacillus faecavium]MBD8036279.1 DUF3021 domain-containing protein [Solibacillus faecavium]
MKNFLISCFVSVFMSYFIIALITYNDTSITWSGAELLHQFLFALSLGVIIGCANNLFLIKHWPYVAVLALHYVIVLCSVFIVGLFGKWFSFDEPSTFFLLFIQSTSIYIIVWCFIFLSIKRDIKRMNDVLKQNRGE